MSTLNTRNTLPLLVVRAGQAAGAVEGDLHVHHAQHFLGIGRSRQLALDARTAGSDGGGVGRQPGTGRREGDLPGGGEFLGRGRSQRHGAARRGAFRLRRARRPERAYPAG